MGPSLRVNTLSESCSTYKWMGWSHRRLEIYNHNLESKNRSRHNGERQTGIMQSIIRTHLAVRLRRSIQRSSPASFILYTIPSLFLRLLGIPSRSSLL
jgi:hypothetical protein